MVNIKNYFLLHFDIASHQRLFEVGKEREVALLYRVVHSVFRQTVELFEGRMAPWQGDGGFAVFDASNDRGVIQAAILLANQWPRISDILEKMGAGAALLEKVRERRFYICIDYAPFVDDENPGLWCGRALSHSLKSLKKEVLAGKVTITKRTVEFLGEGNVDRNPHSQGSINSLGKSYVVQIERPQRIRESDLLKSALVVRDRFIGKLAEDLSKTGKLDGHMTYGHAMQGIVHLVGKIFQVNRPDMICVSTWIRGNKGLTVCSTFPPHQLNKKRTISFTSKSFLALSWKESNLKIAFDYPKEAKRFPKTKTDSENRYSSAIALPIMSIDGRAPNVGMIFIGFKEKLSELPIQEGQFFELLQSFSRELELGIVASSLRQKKGRK